jgi:phage/plasmid-like protein (TIGR03299 family)
MALVRTGCTLDAHRSTYTGTTYAPNTVDGYVAVENRDMPWITIGTALKTGSFAADRNGTKGTTVANKLTAADALEAAGLNFTPDKVQLMMPDGTPTDMYATVGPVGIMGYVGDKYEVHSPADNLGFLDQIIHDHEGAHYTAAWSMREKRQMGVTIDLPEHVVVDPDGAADEMSVHLLGINSFDGSTSIQVATTATRWFCLNQVHPAIRAARRSFCMRHTAGITGRVQEARDALGVGITYATALDEWANALYRKSMTDDAFYGIVKDMIPLEDDASDLITTRRLETWEGIMDTWRAPHNANIAGTRWGALNVLGEYADWGRKVNGSKKTGTDPVRQRAIGTLVNWPAAFKTRTFDRLTADMTAPRALARLVA